MHTMFRRRVVAAAAAALVAPAAALTLGSASSFAATASSTSAGASATTSGVASCATTWGSLPKASAPLWRGQVEGVRAGAHDCFDRMVFDVAPGAGTLGYSVRYVTQVTNPGSGYPVAVTGGARLQVTVNAPATRRIPAAGSASYTGWSTFRQLVWVSSFEGRTDWGLGVRARLPMRAFVLTDADGGRRLVVDVAHRW